MLYDDPGLYADVYGTFLEDLPFYLDICRAGGGAVCELACGSGRITVPLAAAGCTVVGVDCSPEMLDAGRRRAHDAGVAAQFVQADMVDFEAPGMFRTIIVPLHSLSHLLLDEQIDSCFRHVRETLVPGGSFAFAVHNPQNAYLERDPEALFPLKSDRQNPKYQVYERTSWNAKERILDLDWFVETASSTRELSFRLRLFSPDEIRGHLDRAGLEIEGHWGWYDRTPLKEESATQVLLCRKR